MMKIMSKNITNLGRPERPMGSVMISEAHCPEVTVGNTSGAGVLNLLNNDQIWLKEEEWNELFGNSREFTSFDRFSSDETGDINRKQQ